MISVAVRWYLRYCLSFRDVEELLAERGVTVDHLSIYRRVRRFTPEFIEAARPCRHALGDRYFAGETYLTVAGAWTYLYRAGGQHGQVIDALLSVRRDLAAPRRFFTHALRAGTVPVEVTTDRAPVYPQVLDEVVPSALHNVEHYANNRFRPPHCTVLPCQFTSLGIPTFTEGCASQLPPWCWPAGRLRQDDPAPRSRRARGRAGLRGAPDHAGPAAKCGWLSLG